MYNVIPAKAGIYKQIKNIKLTPTNKALETILNHTQNFGEEEVDFVDSLGRVLKENIYADRDFPPFNRVSMDGIAISHKMFENGQRTFKIEGVQAAGSEQLTLKNNQNCIEVMTGAMLPKSCDVVIPYEQVTIGNGEAIVNIDTIDYYKNIHKKGNDKKKDDILISQNTVISSAEIGVLATVGKVKVKVARNPKVMIVSTGDELVEVSETPEEFQIRRSNVHTLVSLLRKKNIFADTAHITDDKMELKQKINAFLSDYDVLLFSGAVSKGKFDFIPEVLEELGVQKSFHKVAQRPGKPFWFGGTATTSMSEHGGKKRRENDAIVFAFPGNPISTFVSCLKYFYPWLEKSVGLKPQNKNLAILANDVNFKPELTYFLQVKLENRNGSIYAIPIEGKGSGDLANLLEVDAFIELPADKNQFKIGEVFPVIEYRI